MNRIAPSVGRVALAAAVLSAVALTLQGCATMKRSQTFTGYPAGPLPGIPLTQNPVPVDPAYHQHGATNTIAFGESFRPTVVLDPKARIDQNLVQTTTTTTVDTKYPVLNP